MGKRLKCQDPSLPIGSGIRADSQTVDSVSKTHDVVLPETINQPTQLPESEPGTERFDHFNEDEDQTVEPPRLLQTQMRIGSGVAAPERNRPNQLVPARKGAARFSDPSPAIWLADHDCGKIATVHQ